MTTDVAAICAGLTKARKANWLTEAWDAFCDCDELPSGIDYQAYIDWLDDTPLVTLRSVEPDDLEDPFAEERGIHADGSVYCLTDLGKWVRAALQQNDEGVSTPPTPNKDEAR